MKVNYEDYHKDRKLQYKIISDHDFTYRSLQYFINKYGVLNKSILDIGCGVGTIDFYLVKKNAKVTGIDISKNAIKVARINTNNLRLHKNIKFRVVDFMNRFISPSYDLIICSEVLEHIKNDKLAVRKIKGLLKPKGLIIASVPSKNAPLYKMGVLKKFDQSVGHLRRYSVKSLINLFKNCGFSVIEVKKTEGIFRNFLFTTNIGSILLKVLNKSPFSELVKLIDDFSILLFGESNIYLIAMKK